MSILFTPASIGKLEIKNRLVHSATHEGMADEKGRVTGELIKRYTDLARGEVGLIITGHMYVHAYGRMGKFQTGIHEDETVPGLKNLVKAIHDQGGRVMFQLNHCGKSAIKKATGQVPISPSNQRRELIAPRPTPMSEEQIQELITDFARAASRAARAGADGVQVHAAHGYLISEFLSPFYNKRKDGYGGSDQNRFRFLKEIIHEINKNVPEDMPVLVKLNGDDCTDEQGIGPELAARYAGWLVELGVAAVEVSCGFHGFSGLATIRGEVPVDEFAKLVPWFLKPVARRWIKKEMVGRFEFEEGYNLAAARAVKPALGQVPLILVGGLRKVEFMEEVINNGDAEFIAICRPLIRQPFLVKQIREGKAGSAACISCNKCFAAIYRDLPVRCYSKGVPS